jgi:hypothetical protein
MLTTRDQLHNLIDSLPVDQLDAAKRALELLAANRPRPSLEDILANAPLDDEPLTPEEQEAIEAGFADFANSRVVSQDDVDREFGR